MLLSSYYCRRSFSGSAQESSSLMALTLQIPGMASFPDATIDHHEYQAFKKEDLALDYQGHVDAVYSKAGAYNFKVLIRSLLANGLQR